MLAWLHLRRRFQINLGLFQGEFVREAHICRFRATESITGQVLSALN